MKYLEYIVIAVLWSMGVMYFTVLTDPESFTQFL